jgi:membrane protein
MSHAWLEKSKILLKESFKGWVSDEAPKLSASLAFYTIFSLAPLLIISIAIASLVFEEEAARGQIVQQIGALVGKQGAASIQEIILRSSQEKTGILATIIGVATLLLGATAVFGELQDSLNYVWKAENKSSSGIRGFLKTRLLSFGLVLVVGFLLLVSLIVTSVLTALTTYFSSRLPGSDFLWHLLNLGVSLIVITILFALIYRILPAVKIAWRDVFFGAAVTAFLFIVGKTLIGLYLGRSAATSSYGAAGSFVLVLLWVYYTAQVFFFGAEFTKVYSMRFGSRRGHVPAT